MKFAFFNDYQLGVITGDQIVAIDEVSRQIEHSAPQQLINGVIAQFSDLKPEIEKAIESNQGVPISGVRIRPPLPRPGKIICAAVNYLEFGTRPPSPLEAFIKSSNSVIGDGDTVELHLSLIHI